MANGFINSNNIRVFPCGSRDKDFDPFANLTTEYNLISIINKLVDKDSFIVTTHSKDIDLSNSTEPYIINIDGYLFTISTGAQGIINLFSETENDNNYIIAKIITSYYEGNNGTIFQMLSPLKNSNSNLQYGYIEVANNGYSQIVGSDIYSKTDGQGKTTYIKKIDTKYYKCNQNGDLIIATSAYSNAMLDNNDSEFIGIEFYRNSTSIKGENTLTLFEKKSAYSQDGDGKYILENGVFKYYNEVPEGTPIKDRYSIKDESWVEYEDSKIKFSTTINGSSRSITIDDGEI